MQLRKEKFRRRSLKMLLAIGGLLPSMIWASSVILSWNPNTEPDLNGYKVYYGTQSGIYTQTINVGNVTQRTITDLQAGETYYFSVTAYDNFNNESDYSIEVSYTAPDDVPPTISSVVITTSDQVQITFSEPVETNSAELTTNYEIRRSTNEPLAVIGAELQGDLRTVHLSTNNHTAGYYRVIVNNVRDIAALNNTIEANSYYDYEYVNQVDQSAPMIVDFELLYNNQVKIEFNEAVNFDLATSQANYVFNPAITINNVSLNQAYKIVTIDTEPQTPGQNYQVTISNIADGSGNVMSEYSGQYTCPSADIVAPQLIRVELISATQIELEFSELLDQTSAEVETNYSITPSVTISNASLDVSGYKVLLTTEAHQPGEYDIEVVGVGDDEEISNVITTPAVKPYQYTLPDNTPPTLVSGELKNGNYLWLTFSERLDEASAQNTNNYAITPSVSITGATLDNTGTKVMLETGNHSKGAYTVTVSNVQDASENTNTIQGNNTYEYSYDPPDQTKPELLSAVLLNADRIELTFSEPLDPISSTDVNNYDLDAGLNIINVYLIGDSSNIVQLVTNSHSQGQEYTVSVSGILDQAETPNLMNNTQKKYDSKTIDQISPRLMNAELQGSRSLKLTFSEPLSETEAEDSTNYQISPAVQINGATLDISGKIVFLLTEAHQAGHSYTISVQNIKDRATTPNVIQSQNGDNTDNYIYESEDKAPPVLERAQILGPQTVELKFNEALDPTSAVNVNNYSIDPSVSISSATLSYSQTVVTLTTAAHNPGSYKVVVSGVKDIAETPNTVLANTEASYNYTPSDTYAPTLVDVDFVNETTIELTFSEGVNRTVAEDTSNYELASGITIHRVIVNDTKVILITDAHQTEGEYTLIVHNIEDYFGNGMPSTVKYYTVAKDDHVRPTLSSVELLGSGTMLEVKFSEAMDVESATDKNNYAINNNVDIVDIVSASGSKYWLQTSEHASGNYKLTVNGVKDASANGNTILDYSQFEYSWNPPDTTGPMLIDARLYSGSINQVELTFDEEIDKTEAIKVANYQIDPEITINQAFHSSDENKVILFTEDHQPGEYRVTVNNVTDKAFVANAIGSNNYRTYEFAPPDTVAPVLVSYDLRSRMSIMLTFDEAIDAQAAEMVSHYSITPNIDVTLATLRRNDNKYNQIVLETTAHQPSVNYKLTIAGLEDRAPVPNALSEDIVIEYNYSPPDTAAPVMSNVKLHGSNKLEVLFNEKVEQSSAETRNNYRIDPSVEVLTAALDTVSQMKVWLETTSHLPGIQYTISARNIRDLSDLGNPMSAGQWKKYEMSTSGQMAADDDPPEVARVEVISSTEIEVIFNEPVDLNTARVKSNYLIDEGVVIQSVHEDTNSTVRFCLNTTPHKLQQSYKLRIKNIKDQASSQNLLSESVPSAYLITPSIAVSHLNQSDYDLSVITQDLTGYTDRDYELTDIPESIAKAVHVLTENDDKLSANSNHLNFEINNDATVYIAYDKNIKTLPGWLKNWKITGEQLVDSRDNVFNLYKKDYKAGQVILGGNYGSMDDNMYQVFIEPHGTSEYVVSVMNKSSYQTSHIQVGDEYYIDRDYTIAAIPDSLEDLLWIKTANDDKTEDDSEFLKVYLAESAIVYVAYDARVKNLPSWLGDWESIDQNQIIDSRGMKFNIYAKEMAKGEVYLGGNEGTIDDNMYLILVRSLGNTLNGAAANPSSMFTLDKNYPNPFNPKTAIPFYVHKEGRVQLKVYNVLGQQVKVLFDKYVEAGYYGEVIWDGTNERGVKVASGIYFYRIQQKAFAQTKRMLLVR